MSKKFSLVALTIALLLCIASLVKSATQVNLGTADDFAVLAGSTITNTGSSVVNGDLGLSPGTSVTGFLPGIVNGTQHITDTAAANAQIDLTTAYNNAAGQTPVTTVASQLGGTTKTAGIYNSADGSFGITGTLTLDAESDPDAVFIFKAASTLTTAGSSQIVLINGAQACNVFWQIGSSAATIGTNSIFKGNILALTSITLTTGANVEGRILARNGAVTLDSNVITTAVCAAAPPPPDPPPPVVPPLISVVKVPTPLVLLVGGGLVTYNYTVTNIGTVPMSNVTVTDNKCAPVSYVFGDTDSDSLLDVSETWIYSCSTTITLTTTNTVTATGVANSLTAIDTANATVVVGLASPPPLIHLIKIPNEFVLLSSGPVTYTYTITNPGVVALSDVSLVDDKCSPMSSRSGDVNSDNLLDVSEAWVYTCQMNLTESTVNTAIAQGSASGLTAIDYAIATVAVGVPGLPRTDGNTNNYSISLSTIMVVLADISAVLGLYKLTRRKQIG